MAKVSKLDSQQIELIGRSLLEAQLMTDGLEVAVPTRDHGVDLLAFLDLGREFVARPFQLKAATSQSFSYSAKYDKFPGLLITYVWNVTESSRSEFYCLNAQEVKDVGRAMGWTESASWSSGSYTVTKTSKKLETTLAQYRMGPGDWRKRVLAP